MKLQSTYDTQFELLELLMAEYINDEYALDEAYESQSFDKVDNLQESLEKSEWSLISKYFEIGLMTKTATETQRESVEELRKKAQESHIVRTRIMKEIKRDRRYRKLEKTFA